MVEASKDWGFCSKDCGSSNQGQAVSGSGSDDLSPKKLQETVVTILAEGDCRGFYPDSQSFDSKQELCAGTVLPLPDMPMYERVKVANGSQTFSFRYLKTTKNPVGETHSIHAHLLQAMLGRFGPKT